jgi:alpha-glucosidase (family GH31 glycosyl hydrolase)
VSHVREGHILTFSRNNLARHRLHGPVSVWCLFGMAHANARRRYRDFTTDPVTFPLSEAKAFFDQLHGDGQHFVPIVDSAIYIPNPTNGSDAYDTYARGNESGAFMTNPDGSQ